MRADEEKSMRRNPAGGSGDSGDGGQVSVSGGGAGDGAGYPDGWVCTQCAHTGCTRVWFDEASAGRSVPFSWGDARCACGGRTKAGDFGQVSVSGGAG